MKLTNKFYVKDFFNELANKCHRYRWFIIGAFAAAIITAIAGAFFRNSMRLGQVTFSYLDLYSTWTIALPLTIGGILTALINLPGKQRYQIMCSKGKYTPAAVNSAFALILALMLSLITAFTPAFLGVCGVIGAVSGSGYYDNVLFTPSQLFLYFAYCLVISVLVIGSVNKFMYYLYTKPIMLVYWVISIGAACGLMILATYLSIYFMSSHESYFDSSPLTVFTILFVAAMLYELENIAIRFFIIRKGDISR